MRRRIGRYRRQEISPFEEVKIGCIMLAEPFFWSEPEWLPVPADFSRNIVRGKGYDTTEEAGAHLWAEVALRQRAVPFGEVGEARAEMWGAPTLIRPRLGQGTFRSLITDTYRRRCLVTGEKALPVLEAAHIRPVSEGGRHEVANGLLLRSDLHRLFDRGYVTITPDDRFRVSRRLKTEFGNGEPYYPLEGRRLDFPRSPEERPGRELLEWHGDVVFRG